MENGVRRWMVDISEWDPSPDHFSSIVSRLPPHDRSAITRFMKFEDRARALLSRLLQYVLVHEVLGIPIDEISIKRTVEGKPYLENNGQSLQFPNFNFNSSHHGDYVGIASEPLCIVGLDIVSHVIPKIETAIEFVRNFSSCFTSLEWNNITSAGSSDAILDEFYRYGCVLRRVERYWCLKEAYIKAIGAGLGYRLDRLEFHHTEWTDISLHVDGEESGEWRFWIFDLGNNHLASVARGHPKRAVDSYQATLPQTQFGGEEYHSGLQLPNTGFTFRTVDEIVRIFVRGSVP